MLADAALKKTSVMLAHHARFSLTSLTSFTSLTSSTSSASIPAAPIHYSCNTPPDCRSAPQNAHSTHIPIPPLACPMRPLLSRPHPFPFPLGPCDCPRRLSRT